MAYQTMRATMQQNPVIYARVSTDAQTLDQQLAACRRLLQPGEEAVVLSEVRSGWDTAGREEYQRLRDMIRSGAVSAVCVYKLDRLGRNAREVYECVCDCRDRGVSVRAVIDNIDTSSPMGMLVVSVLAHVAEMERGFIKQRTREKFAHYREEFGYRGHGSLGGWFSQSAIRAEPAVRALAAAGMRKHTIAKQLGLDPRTVGRILKTPEGTLKCKAKLHAEHPGWYKTPAQQREEFVKTARQTARQSDRQTARQTARKAKPGA